MSDVDPASEIGSRLQASRKKVRPKLSQVAVAEKLGITSRTLSEWESGRSMPTATDLAALARLYGVSADYLLGLAEAENGLPVGRAVLDEALMAALENAPDDSVARELLEERGYQVWFQIPEGAAITTVQRAMDRSAPLVAKLRPYRSD